MNADLSDFKFKVPVQIRFKDLDSLGHVNNANHLSYFELARMGYFNHVVGTHCDWFRSGIILARAEVVYKSPVLLEQQVWVHVRISRIGRSSFDMEYCMEALSGGISEIAATGTSVQVCYNYESKTSIPMPVEWRKKILVFEGIQGEL